MRGIKMSDCRFYVDEDERVNASRYPDEEEFDRIVQIITKRAKNIDPDECSDMVKQLRRYWDEWKAWSPSKYESLSRYTVEEEAPLLYSAGLIRPESWGNRGWATPMSMRNVDRECQLDCSKVLRLEEED